jgi:hypothetical protein
VSVRWRFRVGGVFDIVQFPLIGLKLAGVISWPWSMVLLPLWFFLGSLFIIGLGTAVPSAANAWPCSCRTGETGSAWPCSCRTGQRTTPAEVGFRALPVTG